MLRADTLFAERKFFQTNLITEFENVAEMYSYSSKRGRENELFLTPETVSNVNEMQRMVFRTFPVTSGSYNEAEPSNKRFLPSSVDSGFPSSQTTHVQDRVSPYEGNRLLSDEQIQCFISNTVLPHHRTLINSKGGNWSQTQTDSRPAQPSFQKKTNHAALINSGGLLERPVLQGKPVFISLPQEAQRGSQGSRAHFLDKPQGKLPEFPSEFNVPIKRQGFPIHQETPMNNFSAQFSTAAQVVNSNQKDISYPKEISEGNSRFPKGTQGINQCFPQGSQKEIFTVPTITAGEIINAQCGNSVPQETKEKFINFPQGIQSLSHVSEGTEDDIIIVHDGTPEELLSVFEETLQEIMSIPQGTNVPQEIIEEVIDIPQGITIPQGTKEETTAFHQVENAMAFPWGIAFPQETVAENRHYSQGINIPHGTEEKIIAIPHGSNILKGTVEETMPASHGFTIPQETLYEIMGIPQEITVPQGTLQEMMNLSEGTAVPQGTQEQATPLPNQNKFEGSSSLLYQEIQSFMECQVAANSDVSALHQPCASSNQSTQSLIPVPVPVQGSPKQNHAPGCTPRGRTTDLEPLLASLSVRTNAGWGGTAGQQKDTERSVVTDTVTPGYEFISGNCRKRRRGSSTEATFGKRQRLDLQTNGDSGQNVSHSGENRDAGKMVLSGRNPEDEKFFASIERCLEQSSEAFPSKEKYAFLEDLDNASLDSFPTKVIEDIYENTFKSDCFLTSGDDFVDDSLVFLKHSVLDNLC